jgi:acyl carrier protein
MKVEDVIAKVLRVPAESLNDGSNASNVKRWDSFNHIQVIVALEDQFKIKFTTREISSMKNLGEIKATLRDKGAQVP